MDADFDIEVDAKENADEDAEEEEEEEDSVKKQRSARPAKTVRHQEENVSLQLFLGRVAVNVVIIKIFSAPIFNQYKVIALT